LGCDRGCPSFCMTFPTSKARGTSDQLASLFLPWAICEQPEQQLEADFSQNGRK
jgi:hypothetical protein